jgi:opacity protein-like surface antigen
LVIGIEMKKITIALSVLAASAATASAADLPVKAKPIIAAGFDWSGVYIGAHAGYGGGMNAWEAVGPAGFIARGALAGGQVGINRQLGSFVFGLELDGSWADIKGTGVSTTGGPALGVIVETRATSKVDSFVTFAGRAGIAADRWFVFAKGGITAAHEKHDFLANVNTIVGGAVVATGTGTANINGSETRYAPMLGFGAEYALAGPWSILAEYNYHHFGAATARLTGTSTTAGVVTPLAGDNRVEQVIHVARLGVNYRFGGVAVDPSYAPVPAAPGTNWTGAYIGAQGGYGWGQTQWPDAIGTVPANIQSRFDNSGWLAGGTIGANAQAGRFVFGVEGEILATEIKGNFTSTIGAGPTVVTTTYASKIDWLALASARAGFVVGDRLMLYGKGGLAIAEEQHSAAATQTTVPVTALSYAGKAVHTGAVIGAGGEYAFAPNWSVKAEYNYIKMFAQQVQLQGTVAGGPFGGGGQATEAASKITQDLHLVKFGVNYHFNPQPVVAARY